MTDVPSIDDVQDPGEFEEPGATTEEPMEEAVVLTVDETAMFEEALFVGRKEKIVEVLGHEVYIHTLTVDEELKLSLLIKEWEDSRGFARAFKAAVVAASVREIDGKPVYQPLSSEREENDLTKKFQRIRKFYPIFIDKIYAEITELEESMGRELMEKLGK